MTAQTILPANSVTGGDLVTNSGRFNDASPDILKNGTESDGNRKVWTISMWIKRSKLGVRQTLWNWGSNSSSEGGLYIDANDFLVLNNDNQQGSSNEVAGVLRDTSAWYHIVWRCDVTETNNIDRWRCYINGVQRTLTDAADVSNADGEINKNGTHQNWIGGAARSLQSGNAVYPFGGYIAEAVFVDGQALAPTSFGEFDEDSSIWKPIDVSGLTFGDEGVYLNFQNAAELGTDVSGNGNTYAETGLDATNQSTDTCTNNFCTLNPLTKRPTANGTIAEGNLQYTASTGDSHIYGTMAIPPGMKVYFEVKLVSNTAQNAIGIHNVYDGGDGTFIKGGGEAGTYSFKPRGASSVTQYFNNGSATNHSIDNVANDTIIGVAVDNANGQIHYSIAGTYINSSDPTDNNPVALVTGFGGANEQYLHFSLDTTSTNPSNQFNFGSPPYSESGGESDADGHGNFNQAVPSGYFALCTKNLAEYG
jgi:hypothetical protein